MFLGFDCSSWGVNFDLITFDLKKKTTGTCAKAFETYDYIFIGGRVITNSPPESSSISFHFSPFFRKGIAASLCITTMFSRYSINIPTHFFESFFKKTSQKILPSLRPSPPQRKKTPPLELRWNFEPPPVSPRCPCLSVAAHDANSLQGSGLVSPNPISSAQSCRHMCVGPVGWSGFSYLKRWVLGKLSELRVEKGGILLMHPNRCNHEKQRAICDVHFFRTIFSPLETSRI